MKMIRWIGTSHKDLKQFSNVAKQKAGYQLHLVQIGEEPTDSKPMKSIGTGVKEIRIHTEVENRVIYMAKFEEAVYILHTFEKKTQKTSKNDTEIARTRMSDLIAWRKENGFC